MAAHRRSSPLIAAHRNRAQVRDLFIIVVAGLLLGFLFEGTLEKVRCEDLP